MHSERQSEAYKVLDRELFLISFWIRTLVGSSHRVFEFSKQCFLNFKMKRINRHPETATITSVIKGLSWTTSRTMSSSSAYQVGNTNVLSPAYLGLKCKLWMWLPKTKRQFSFKIGLINLFYCFTMNLDSTWIQDVFAVDKYFKDFFPRIASVNHDRSLSKMNKISTFSRKPWRIEIKHWIHVFFVQERLFYYQKKELKRHWALSDKR